MHNKDFLGKEVVSSDAWTVGTIRQVVINQGSWQVTALEVLLSAEEPPKGATKVAGKLGDATDKVTDKLGIGPVTDKVGLSTPSADDEKKERATITIDQIQGIDDKITLKIPRKDVNNNTSAPSMK